MTGIGGLDELEVAARVHPKALVYMHRYGRVVPEELLGAARAWVVEHNARWRGQ